MVEALVDTYWRVKTERADVTRTLYRSVAELDNQPLIGAFARRVDAATMSMLASATDVTFKDLKGVNLTLLTVIFGTVRNTFERNLPYSTAQEGGFNWSMQHTKSCVGRRSVADEVPDTNLLHGQPEGIDVGALESWLDSSSDRSAV